MERPWVTIDGNEAVAMVAHKLSEVIAIYPITPSTPMGELADAWSAAGRANIWGTTPLVAEMQSEGGAAGAIHGALTTARWRRPLRFAGPAAHDPQYARRRRVDAAVFHERRARWRRKSCLSLATVRRDGHTHWLALLSSGSVQEAQDLALIAHAATLRRASLLHFFDGFRTSHEINKIEQLAAEDLRAMIDGTSCAHTARPFARSARNPRYGAES